MHKQILLTIFVLSLSTFAFGQKNRAQQQPVENTPGKTEQGSLLNAETGLEAELISTIDVKKAKVGDRVLLKTTQAVKSNGETVIQKGSHVVGRVTEVARKGKDNASSRIGLVFDRIEGKSLNAPIEATIVSIVDTRTALSAADNMAMTDVSGSSSTSARSSGGGGGLLGGVGSTVGGVVNTAARTTGAVAGTAVNTVGTAPVLVGDTLRGVSIQQSASGSANGGATLTSPTGSLRLEKGVTFNLLVSGGN
jgi:hypothetical protein